MKTNRVTLCLSILGATILLMAVPQIALADNTCNALIASNWNQANTNSQWYNVELTIHREDVKLVEYSSGWLAPNADGSFSGGSNQLFTDRLAGNQPFDINQADWLDLGLSPSGSLTINYHPWNFSTTWDLSCQGSMLSTYLPGFGRVTLTFRDLFYPIG